VILEKAKELVRLAYPAPDERAVCLLAWKMVNDLADRAKKVTYAR